MNKELEEAVETLIEENATWKKEKAIKTLRNYIENSIPKEKIEKLLDYDKANYIDCIKANNKKEAISKYIEHLKQELLEGK